MGKMIFIIQQGSIKHSIQKLGYCKSYMLYQLLKLYSNIRYNQIYYQKQKMQRLDRRSDKENSLNGEFVSRNKTPVTSKTPLTPSNNSLRKKLDEKLANYEQLRSNEKANEQNDQNSVEYDNRRGNEVIKGKRENAKNRGFDIKVNNIACINQKISSLLNLVKKDKNQRNDRNDKAEKERQANLSRGNDSPNIQIGQRYRKEATTPTVSPFVKEKFETRQADDYPSRNEGNADNTYIPSWARLEDRYNGYNDVELKVKGSSKEQSLKDMNIKQLRKKYLPDEPAVQKSKNKNDKGRRENSSTIEVQLQEIRRKTNQSIDHLTSIVQKEDQSNFTSKKKNIDKMLEERKKKREQERLQERAKFEKTSLQDSTENEYYHTRKGQENSNLTLINPINENQRNQKINTTTRLIDEQIKRIKSKIDQSESNNQKNITKMKDKQSSLKNTNSARQKQHTTKIAACISSQVEFDNKLRQARVAFEKMNDQNKWANFQKALQSNGVKMSIQYIKEMMRVSPDEHNPFLEQGRGANCEDIVTLYLSAQGNWENNVCGCTTKKSLDEQDFCTQEIDLNQKGSLSIEDIVCFINLYTGHFYRNRDLSLIFRRFQLYAGEVGNNLSYKGFEKTLIS